MKNNWCKWLLLVWLFLLTLVVFALIVRTHELEENQKKQQEILIHQTEIIALNTVMLRAIIVPSEKESE
jgi:hypothetical protein